MSSRTSSNKTRHDGRVACTFRFFSPQNEREWRVAWKMQVSIMPKIAGQPHLSGWRGTDLAFFHRWKRPEVTPHWSSKCQNCALKSQCTPSTERRIRRWEHEAVLEEMQIRLTKAPENDASPKQTVAGCPDVEIVLVIEVIVPTDGRLSHEPKTACREKTLAGASLVHADTSRLIQSSSTLVSNSGLCNNCLLYTSPSPRDS